MNPQPATAHLDRILATAKQLGATVTERADHACFDSRCSYGTPSFRYESGKPVHDDDVIRYDVVFGDRSPGVLDFAVSVGMNPTQVFLQGGAGDLIISITAWRHALTAKNGRDGNGITLATTKTTREPLSQRTTPHFYTDEKGDLHVGLFA